MRRFPAIALILCAASFVGCGTSPPDEKPDVGIADAGPDMSGETDTGPNPSGNDAADPVEDGELEVGYNVAFEASPDDFVPLADGDEIPITFGVQGSWMVVLAFRTHDLFEGEFDVVGEVTIDGEEVGRIWLELQETFPGGDGWDYYTNLFLAIDYQPDRGTPVHVLMRVIDTDGNEFERELDLLIGPVAE